jgi:pantetheine-phosphate adenylyltransferase
MKIAVYPGSFDPVTNGHLDIIRRVSLLTDKLVVAIGNNIDKNPIFDCEERQALIQEVVKDIPRVEVQLFSGMTVDFCLEIGARIIVRGIRGLADADDEITMALTNRSFTKEVETLFMIASPEHGFVSSRLIRETAALGGRIDHLVPRVVAEKLYQRLQAG